MRQRGMREWDWETVLKMTRKIVGGQDARGKREELEAHDSAQSREHIGYVCSVTATPSRISTMY
jgi:hypothetical protein